MRAETTHRNEFVGGVRTEERERENGSRPSSMDTDPQKSKEPLIYIIITKKKNLIV